MPRPRKCRRIGFMPENFGFEPVNPSKKMIELLPEELEAIRLIDLEGLDQSAAAESMDVSRGTYQRILNGARQKIAQALVHGYGIRLRHEDAPGHGPGCGCGRRFRGGKE